jgi:hypothetical protein
MPDLIILTDKELDELRARYTWQEPPPCPVCQQPLDMVDSGGDGPATFRCASEDARSASKSGVALTDAIEHYRRSQWRQSRASDNRVVAVIEEVRALRAKSRG